MTKQKQSILEKINIHPKKLADRILLFLVTMAVGAPTFVGITFFLMTHTQISKAISDLTTQTKITLEAEISAKNKELAEKISILLNERVKRLHSLIVAASIIPEVVDLNAEYSEFLLKKFVYQNPSFLEISVADRRGQEIVKVSRDDIVLKKDFKVISDLAKFADSTEAKSYKTEVKISEKTGLPFIVLFQPIERYKGRLQGWLIVSIDLSYLWDLISSTSVGEGGYTYVVAVNGQLISHPNKKLIYQGKDPFADVFKDIPINEEGTIKTKKYLLTYVHTTYLNWRVVTVLPLEEALKPVIATEDLLSSYLKGLLSKMGNFLLLISPLLFFIGTIIALFLTKGITTPILKLVKGTQAIAKGNFSTRVNVKTDDEIGVLATSFNHMAEEMERLVQKERELAAAEAAADTERARSRELKDAYEKLKRTQNMLLHAEKLSAVGQLASGVAHEVKNPLGIISQGLKYIQLKLNIKDKELQKDFDLINDAVKRADKIIRGLLDFSVPTKLELKPADLTEVIDASVELVAKELSLSGIKLKKEIPSSLPKVMIDHSQMQQVFINLLLNAVHAMPKGGDLIIRCYTRNIDEFTEGIGRRSTDFFTVGDNTLVCEIEDHGHGIPKNILPRVFEPFFTTKAPGKGTGLGLPVTRSIIDTHRGLIDIKSTEGKGTTMIITLPVVKGEKHA